MSMEFTFDASFDEQQDTLRLLKVITMATETPL